MVILILNIKDYYLYFKLNFILAYMARDLVAKCLNVVLASFRELFVDEKESFIIKAIK